MDFWRVSCHMHFLRDSGTNSNILWYRLYASRQFRLPGPRTEAVAAQAHRDLGASPFQVIRPILAGDLCNNRSKFPGPAVQLLEQLENLKISRGDRRTPGRLAPGDWQGPSLAAELVTAAGRRSRQRPRIASESLRPPAAYVPVSRLALSHTGKKSRSGLIIAYRRGRRGRAPGPHWH